MKKSLILALAIVLAPILLGAVSEALASMPEPVIKAARPNHHYDGPISTPTLVDTINLSPLSVTDPVGLTYDWERDALWIGQYTDSAVYAIQKTSPCTKVDSFDLGTGTPSHHWGIAYGGNDTLYIADNDGNIYRIDMQTGQGTVYRQGIGYTQGVGFNPVDEVIYVSDNNVVQCAWASPPDTGPWHAWNAPPGTYPQDMSGACSSTNTLDYLFHNEWFSSPGHFYQYSVTNGIPNTKPRIQYGSMTLVRAICLRVAVHSMGSMSISLTRLHKGYGSMMLVLHHILQVMMWLPSGFSGLV